MPDDLILPAHFDRNRKQRRADKASQNCVTHESTTFSLRCDKCVSGLMNHASQLEAALVAVPATLQALHEEGRAYLTALKEVQLALSESSDTMGRKGLANYVLSVLDGHEGRILSQKMPSEKP